MKTNHLELKTYEKNDAPKDKQKIEYQAQYFKDLETIWKRKNHTVYRIVNSFLKQN